MNYLQKTYKHFKTVCKHKYYVGKYCFKFGLYWQGVIHDLSKFSPTEFWTSVKYFQGYRSPIDAEKEDLGYSIVWTHHHNRNPHHWLYFVDFNNVNDITPVRIPYKYALEAICDWIGAGMVYSKGRGQEFHWYEPYEYYKRNTRIGSNKNIHWQTRQLWDTILVDLKNKGFNYVASKVKNGSYKKIYTKFDNSIKDYPMYNKIEYKLLLDKYYN